MRRRFLLLIADEPLDLRVCLFLPPASLPNTVNAKTVNINRAFFALIASCRFSRSARSSMMLISCRRSRQSCAQHLKLCVRHLALYRHRR